MNHFLGLLGIPFVNRTWGPDLNPIEMAFAKLKAHLRRIGARTIDELWKAVGGICKIYSDEERWNHLKASVYVAD